MRLVIQCVLILVSGIPCCFGQTAPQLRVVATLPDYAVLAKAIGGDRIAVETIVRGDQDAHFIRPKPSFVTMVQRADVLISTGLDLELWLPTVINKSGTIRLRSGQVGYIAASKGVRLLEKPANLSRSEGGVHVYGNPHITCSPINMKTAARNICHGLGKNDPGGKAVYEANLTKLLDEIDRRLFGPELVTLIGGKSLCAMAEKGALIPFLQKHKYRNKPLIEALGGWMKEMYPLRGVSIVTYHKNWIYFLKIFGLKERGTVEPKPGIPPSPKHVAELIERMRKEKIKLLLAANYFDAQRIKTVASRVGAAPVIVPIYVGGAANTQDYFMLVDHWIAELVAAAKEKHVITHN